MSTPPTMQDDLASAEQDIEECSSTEDAPTDENELEERNEGDPRLKLREEQKARRDQERTTRLRRIASTKSAEKALDGPVDRVGGARDKTGKKRGPYRVGGGSVRTAQRKRKKIADDAAGRGLDRDDPSVKAQLERLRNPPKSISLQQSTLSGFLVSLQEPSPGSSGTSGTTIQQSAAQSVESGRK